MYSIYSVDYLSFKNHSYRLFIQNSSKITGSVKKLERIAIDLQFH